MKRRYFINKIGRASVAGFLGSTISSEAKMQVLGNLGNGWVRYQVGIDSNLANISAIKDQEQSQWCWAACISTVFRYYGYKVSQQRIVAETWGQIVNLPAQPQQILTNLNRPWQDDDGKSFFVTGDTYTATAANAAQDLNANRPLIIGTQSHAMVLTSMIYARNEYNSYGIPELALVRDPWPGKGKRPLTAVEWNGANFLCRIEVKPI